jgi:hypothetical protein
MAYRIRVAGGVRRVARTLGTYIDEEDRTLLAQAGSLVAAAGAILVVGAALLGLAWRVLFFAAG